MWKPGIIAAKEYDNEKLAERIEKEKKLSNTNRSEDYEIGSLDESLQYTEDNLDHWKCDYVVVGPLSDPLQCATGERCFLFFVVCVCVCVCACMSKSILYIVYIA